MMYYGLVCLAVVMFGMQFFTTRGYQKEMGSSLFSALFNTFIGGLIGFPLMLIINKFTFEYTHFTFLMALLKYIDGFLFSLCSVGVRTLCCFRFCGLVGNEDEKYRQDG